MIPALLILVLILATRKGASNVDSSQSRLLFASRGLLDSERITNVRLSAWTDAELISLCEPYPYGQYVFATAYVEQGANHLAVGGSNAWGVEAFGPGPRYGWSQLGAAPIGWGTASEGGTGVTKPFLLWDSLADGVRAVEPVHRTRGINTFRRYLTLWNGDGMPESWQPKAEARWNEGISIWENH